MIRNTIILTIALLACAIAGTPKTNNDLDSLVGPVVYFGVSIDQSDYALMVTSEPTLYRNKATKRDTIIVDTVTTRVFYTPKTVVIGFYTTYGKGTSLLMEGMTIVTSMESMIQTITDHCDHYKLVRNDKSYCMAYVNDIPTHIDELEYVTESAHESFLTATGCGTTRECKVFPLSATIR